MALTCARKVWRLGLFGTTQDCLQKEYRGLGGLGHSLLNNSFEQQVLISDKMTIISSGGLPEVPALTKHFTAVICGTSTLSTTTPCLTTAFYHNAD